MTVRTHDTQRARVYAAERILSRMIDNADTSGCREVDLVGTRITLPVEARFADVEATQRYIDEVFAMPSVVERFGEHPPVTVRHRRGVHKAHYDPMTNGIAVPFGPGSAELRRELTLIHESCHHLTRHDPIAHGPAFAATYIDLATLVMGPEAGFILRVLFDQNDVSTG